MKWIGVNDNLPKLHTVDDGYDVFEESAPVLVFCESGRMAVAQYGVFDGKSYWGGYDMGAECVTHWMPLPETPKH